MVIATINGFGFFRRWTMQQPDRQQSGRGRGRRRHDRGSQRPPEATDGGRHQQRPPRSEHPGADAPTPSASAPSHPPRPSRRGKFKATLTEAPEAQASTSTPPRRKPRPRRASPPGDDLTSTLTHALRTPPYPDCMICFSPIRPEHPTWSCSPPVTGGDLKPNREGGEEEKTCCWTTLHLKCIRAWAEKSIKDLEEAWRARGESHPGEWHCPGCRATRQVVPHTYKYVCVAAHTSMHFLTTIVQMLLSPDEPSRPTAYRDAAFMRAAVLTPPRGVYACLSAAVSPRSVSAMCGDDPGSLFLQKRAAQREMPGRLVRVGVLVRSTMSQTFAVWQFGACLCRDVP